MLSAFRLFCIQYQHYSPLSPQPEALSQIRNQTFECSANTQGGDDHSRALLPKNDSDENISARLDGCL
jgi:hypothetical protein